MSNDPDGETTLRMTEAQGGKPRSDGELAELAELAELEARAERWRASNALLEEDVARLRAELATLEAGSRAAAAVLSERERLRAVLRPTPQNCAVVLAAWKGDDFGSGDERAVRVLEALALVAGIGEKGT